MHIRVSNAADGLCEVDTIGRLMVCFPPPTVDSLSSCAILRNLDRDPPLPLLSFYLNRVFVYVRVCREMPSNPTELPGGNTVWSSRVWMAYVSWDSVLPCLYYVCFLPPKPTTTTPLPAFSFLTNGAI